MQTQSCNYSGPHVTKANKVLDITKTNKFHADKKICDKNLIEKKKKEQVNNFSTFFFLITDHF